MADSNTQEVLDRLEDPDISSEELTKIWESTRSPKIRKSIASHPNASSEVLEMAARLYINEVLDNPGFKLMSMFATDKLIGNLEMAYRDPQGFIARHGCRSIIGKKNAIYAKAIYLSDNLKFSDLNSCLRFSNKSAYDQVTKSNPEIVGKLRKLTKNHLSQSTPDWDLEILSILLDRKIINVQECLMALRCLKAADHKNLSCPKRDYLKMVENLSWKYYIGSSSNVERADVLNCITLMLDLSQHWCVEWAINGFSQHFYDGAWGRNYPDKGEKIVLEVYKRTSEDIPKAVTKKFHSLVTRVLSADGKPWNKEGIALGERIRLLYEFLEANGILGRFCKGQNSLGITRRFFLFGESNCPEAHENWEDVKNLPLEVLEFAKSSRILANQSFWNGSLLQEIIAQVKLAQ